MHLSGTHICVWDTHVCVRDTHICFRDTYRCFRDTYVVLGYKYMFPGHIYLFLGHTYVFPGHICVSGTHIPRSSELSVCGKTNWAYAGYAQFFAGYAQLKFLIFVVFLILFLPDTLSSRRIRSVAGYALSVFGEHERMRLSVFGKKKPAGYAQFTPDTLSSHRIRSVYAGYAQSELIRRLRKHPPDTLSSKKK